MSDQDLQKVMVSNAGNMYHPSLTHIYHLAVDDIVYFDFGVLACNAKQRFPGWLVLNPRAGIISGFLLSSITLINLCQVVDRDSNVLHPRRV